MMLAILIPGESLGGIETEMDNGKRGKECCSFEV
jgi:hypothetical protein